MLQVWINVADLSHTDIHIYLLEIYMYIHIMYVSLYVFIHIYMCVYTWPLVRMGEAFVQPWRARGRQGRTNGTSASGLWQRRLFLLSLSLFLFPTISLFLTHSKHCYHHHHHHLAPHYSGTLPVKCLLSSRVLYYPF